jgi:DNA-binding NtrC family response regulator
MKAKILVVDDDATMRDALGDTLHREGYVVQQAENRTSTWCWPMSACRASAASSYSTT